MGLGPVMLDVEGTALTPADRDLLQEPAVGGVILFSRNYSSPEQLADLVTEIRALRSPPLLIAVDHEGGRVQRFRKGFTPMPAMRSLGHQFDSDPAQSLAMARDIGWLIGAELRAQHIDLAFAPCVDLDLGLNDAIGDRSFHRKPEVVGQLATSFCQGMRHAGMAPVAKHFPGHGGVVADSHERLPVDRRDFGHLLDDMRPYDLLLGSGGLPAVMLSHIVYRELDALPAGFSAYWIGEQLRNQLGFSGAVLSDDLSMKATASFGPMPQRARLALEAGCDMVLICNDRAAAQSAVTELRDYSNPSSLVRLARLHGGQRTERDALLASDDWQQAADRLAKWGEPPSLTLDA